MVDRIHETMEEGTRAYLLAPIIREPQRRIRKEFIELRKSGLPNAFKVNGEFFHELDEPTATGQKIPPTTTTCVDRSSVREGLETAAGGQLAPASTWPDGIRDPRTAGDETPSAYTFFRRNLLCPVKRLTIPRDRAAACFRSRPFGACPSVYGWARNCSLTKRLVCPNQNLKIYDGALAPWRKGKSP